MKIRDIGGEFALIERLRRNALDRNVLAGIGDDCAVVRTSGLQLLGTDALVEGSHFSLDYFSPQQVGMKAITQNVSDVAAMGGLPKYALVSLILQRDIEVFVVEGIYEGMRKRCLEHNMEIIGGNITHGKELSITITIIGEARRPVLRSCARPGDMIFVSGTLGGSAAGLKMLLNKIPGFSYVKDKHLEPQSAGHKVEDFLDFVNSMIDVSDGLAPEIGHICKESGLGAVIFKKSIPIEDEVFAAARRVGQDAYDYALFGGEDFELVYTVSKANISKVKGFLVGEIRSKKGIYLDSNGKENLIERKGYDHFIEQKRGN